MTNTQFIAFREIQVDLFNVAYVTGVGTLLVLHHLDLGTLLQDRKKYF